MKDMFITSNNFVDYMREAVNVYIASAYLNRFIIDNIKADLAKLPYHGGRNFRFLLNHDFHEDAQMRRVLVNMLLELPNTEVRIYRGERFFHPKLYIFESGNSVFVAVGSFNATEGGAGMNIEAGVRLHNREIYRDAKEFFDRYWDSEFTETAGYDETAVFIEKKFKPGDPVTILSRGEEGVIVNVEPEQRENEWYYSVFSTGRTTVYSESDLAHIRIWYSSHLDTDFTDVTILAEKWALNYVLEKAFSLPEKTLASYGSSRTEVYAYQFRPLLKMIHSAEHRLLIADEVGLGKTIEAGIILKEFLFRMSMKRILIIVPNSLKTKWRDELRIRFDEYYDIVTRRDLLGFLGDYEQSPEGASIKGIITYDQLASSRFKAQLENLSPIPTFDMIIIDEAHHLKNEETIRHSVVKRLTRNSSALILLTATPIQLATKDLFNLLTILLPKYSNDSLAFSVKLTLNQRLMEALQKLENREFADFGRIINEIQSTVSFRKQLEHFDDHMDILSDCARIDDTTEEAEVSEMRSRLYSLNILSRYISRTLRKDAGLRFPERKVVTQLYEYSPEEKSLYTNIVSHCQKYSDKGSKLVLVSIERQAASSLPAFCRKLEKTQYAVDLGDYEIALKDLDDEDSEAGAQWSDNQLNGLKSDLMVIQAPERDSKLQMLREIIKVIFTGDCRDRDKKVLIFCGFLATIDYLRGHLSVEYPNVCVDTMTGDDNVNQRDEKRKAFRDRSPSILICSEVAGEGLDFQFCHYLVNYDMPWNPSKLEQRVGRIDRLGQEADVVTIINLVNRFTIEDYIMAKLFERVTLFNSTLGPLGEVLGLYQSEFSSNVLRAERTEQEKEEYERKVSARLEQKRKEQEAFDESQVELFGVLDYFYDEELKKHTRFTESEIALLWNTFWQSTECASREETLTSPECDVFALRVTDAVRQMLQQTIDRGISGILNSRKKEHYRALIDNAHTSDTPIKYTFNQRKALDTLSLEFLTISHPFVAGALQHLQSDYEPNRAVLSCVGAIPGWESGDSFIFVYRFEIQSMDAQPRCHHNEERTFVYCRNQRRGRWEPLDIVNGVLRCTRGAACSAGILSAIAELDGILSVESKREGARILEEYHSRSMAAVELRRDSLKAQYDTKIEQRRLILQSIQDPYYRGQAEREIEHIKDEKARRLKEITASRHRIAIQCSGIIALEREVMEPC